MLRINIPKINDDTFQQIFPSDNILCITQKTGGRHFVHLRDSSSMGHSMELIGSVFSSNR